MQKHWVIWVLEPVNKDFINVLSLCARDFLSDKSDAPLVMLRSEPDNTFTCKREESLKMVSLDLTWSDIIL